jgi:polyhydroxyalkanoate synthase
MTQQALVERFGKQRDFPMRTELGRRHPTATEGTSPRDEDPPNLATLLADAADLGTKVLTGGMLLHGIRDANVQIATTPKDLVWRQDKVSLFQFRPLAEQRIGVPMLICYGPGGRWTMIDLQDDRSLVRNLLDLGLDLYVVAWGNPSRADRFLTLDDHILGYLGDRVGQIAGRAGVPNTNLLGICEGEVFATAFAALEPQRIHTLTLSITPIDLEPAWLRLYQHLDAQPGPRGHRPSYRRKRKPAR